MDFRILGRALAHRNFRLFVLGQGVSLIGTWMQQVGVTWLVYRLTGSALLLGLVGFSSQAPTFLLAPLGGYVADRRNRHRALLVTQSLAMLEALLLVLLTWTGHIEVWHILVICVLQGTINAFDMPLRQSFLVEMVPRREDLANAIAINSSIFNGARLVGPSLAGLLIAVGGEITCFLVNAGSYFAVLLALLAMRALPQRPVPVRMPLVEGLREGFGYAYGFRPIRALLMLVSLTSLTAMPLMVLLPVFATKYLDGGPETLGFLMAASGVGALGGAIYLAARREVPGLGRVVAAAGLILGTAMFAFSWSQQLGLSLGLLVVVGLTMILQMGGCNTLLQTIVDEDKRGRVMSLYTMAFMGVAPLGSLLAGAIADRWGAALAVQIGGLLCLAGAAYFFRALPQLREMVRPIYIRRGLLPPAAEALQVTTELTTPPEEVA